MTKSGYFIFLLIVLCALFFFVRLAVETFKQGEGTPQQRDTNMEQYVKQELE